MIIYGDRWSIEPTGMGYYRATLSFESCGTTHRYSSGPQKFPSLAIAEALAFIERDFEKFEKGTETDASTTANRD